MVEIFTRDAGSKKSFPMTDYIFKPRRRKWDESSVSPEDRKMGVGNLWLIWIIQQTCFPTDVQNSNCLALLLNIQAYNWVVQEQQLLTDLYQQSPAVGFISAPI